MTRFTSKMADQQPSQDNLQVESVEPTSDLETDASPIGPCLNQIEEETLPDLRARIQKTLQLGKAQVTHQSGTVKDGAVVDDTSIPFSNKNNDLMDILILHVPDDYEGAKRMKERIEQNKFCDETLTPKVTLYDDFIHAWEHKRFEYAVSRTLFIFVYFTKLYCKDFEASFQSHVCLKKSLNDENAIPQIIPVHTLAKKDRDYKLPLLLEGLRPLNLFLEKFQDDVKRLLEHYKPIIVERRMKEKKNENNLQVSTFAKVECKNADEETHKMQVASSSSCTDSQFNSAVQKTLSTSTSHEQTLNQSQVQPVTTASTENQRSSTTNASLVTETSKKMTIISQETVLDPVITEEVSSHTDTITKLCSSSVGTSTVSFSSHPEPESDKAVPFNVSSYTSTVQAQEGFISRQVIPNLIASNVHLRPPAIEVDSENPSDGSQNIQNSNIREAIQPFFFLDTNRGTLPAVPMSSKLSNRSAEDDVAPTENRINRSGQVYITINSTNVQLNYGNNGVMNIATAPVNHQDSEDVN